MNDTSSSIDFEKVMAVFKRREKFIMHNNYCILEIIAFYDNFFLNRIIKEYLLNDNYDKNDKVKKIITTSLSFTDKYKIVKEIAKEYNIVPISQKHFEDFEYMRNTIAHNLSSVSKLNSVTKQNKIILGGKEMLWTDYLNDLKKWADYSYEMAKFTKDVFSKVDSKNSLVGFGYCKIEGNCVLVEHSLLFPEPDGEYISFFKNGFDTDLLEYLNEEIKYNKGVDPNE